MNIRSCFIIVLHAVSWPSLSRPLSKGTAVIRLLKVLLRTQNVVGIYLLRQLQAEVKAACQKYESVCLYQ